MLNKCSGLLALAIRGCNTLRELAYYLGSRVNYVRVQLFLFTSLYAYSKFVVSSTVSVMILLFGPKTGAPNSVEKRISRPTTRQNKVKFDHSDTVNLYLYKTQNCRSFRSYKRFCTAHPRNATNVMFKLLHLILA